MKRMKKVLSLLLAFIIGFGLVGCGGKKLSSIAIKDGTITYGCVVNTTYDTSKIQVVATYSDETTEDIVNDKLTFSAIDTSTVGNKTLTITYEEKTTTAIIKVVNDLTEAYDVKGFGQPQFVQDYLDQCMIDETRNEKDNFTTNSDPYVVGDDNKFVYLPEITALKIEAGTTPTDIVLNKYESVVQVFEKQGNAYTELTGTNLTNIVAVDNKNSSFDFTESAIGKTYKISVRPANLTAAQLEAVSDWTLSFEFKVVDGWNVQSVAELSRYSNCSNTKNTEAWSEYKTANNIGNQDFDAMILHSNLNITTNDIPRSFIYQPTTDINTDPDKIDKQNAKWNDNMIGTLKDDVSIYNREVAEGETFIFYGNYFTINANSIPVTKFESSWRSNASASLTANTTLFSSGGVNNSYEAVPEVGHQLGKTTFYNLKLFGNSGYDSTRLEDDNYFTELIGTLSAVRTNNELTTFNNLIAINFKTTFFSMDAMNMYNTKVFGAFTSALHVWDTESNYLENCTFKACSGPLIMITASANTPALETKNCTFENWISSTDPWFNAFGMTEKATQLIGLNPLIAQASTSGETCKSFVKYENGKELVNFICVVQGSNGKGSNKGSINIKNVEGNLVGTANLADPRVMAFNTSDGSRNLAPLFQSSEPNGFAFTNNTYVLSPTNAPINDPNHDLFKGDCFTIYAPAELVGGNYVRMGFVLDLIDIQTSTIPTP